MTLSYILVPVHGFCNMEFMVILLAFSGLVMARSSLDELPVHPGVGGLYRGPNSETIIKGPDGSVITAETEAGSIQTQSLVEPIVVADPADVQSVYPVAEVQAAAASLEAVPAAIVAVPAAPVAHTIEVIQPDPHIIETEVVDAPVIEPQQSSDLVGPSGSISTRGSSSVVSGPASTTISEPARVLVATPLVAAIPVIASVKTPLRVTPIVEVSPDLPASTISPVLQPTISTVTASPPIHVSPELTFSSAPLANGGSTATIGILSTTLPPPEFLVSTPTPGLLSSTAANVNVVEPQQNLGVAVQQPAATISSASSYGVIENSGAAVPISSTIRPELSGASTLAPRTLNDLSTSSLGHALVNSRQLSINPSLIPSANIIPPEIGPLANGAIDLGTTVTVSSTQNPSGLLPTIQSSNIQRIDEVSGTVVDNSLRSIDGRLVQVQATAVQSQGGGISPVPTSIPPNGLIGSGLAKYGIDSSQINLAQVPLSSATRIPSAPKSTLDEEIDDVSATLWNRYGRDVNGKEDEKDEKVEDNKN